MAFFEKDFLKWLVHINDVKPLWVAQPTYLVTQAVIVLAGFISLIHAFKKGGRWPYFWLTTFLHGLISENIWYLVPEYDTFWHAQSPVMLLGGRLPLYVLFLYPFFIYNAAYAVSKANLPLSAESFAVGLATLLLDLPYDIVGVKFLHWTWHDTDPNVYDRHYWVPWNSYFFHVAFSASLYYFFTASRKWFGASNVQKWQSAGFVSELKSVITGSLLGVPGGVLLFLSIYQPLHDIYRIHSEVTFFILLAISTIFVLNGLLSLRERITEHVTKMDHVLFFMLVVHLGSCLSFLLVGAPEQYWSYGQHQKIGPCNEQATLITPLGQKLFKQKYLCLSNYDEKYFDFHCLRNLPANGAEWYTICGTPFNNLSEYVTVVGTAVLAAVSVYFNLYFKTAPLKPSPPATRKYKTK